MSRTLRLALVVLAGVLCLSAVARAETGVVQGQVINGTAGANTALGGLPVRLYLFSGNTLKDTQRATTDAQGVFRFEAAPAGSGWIGVAVVEYGGVEYESGLLDLSVGTDFSADIPVYETTTDESSLAVERSHLIIEMGSGQLEVTEMIILSNVGDRTYIGSEEVIPDKLATARVPLPAGAVDVTFSSSEAASAMVRTGQGFVDTRPIVPGQHEYVLSYALPCEGSTYNLVKPVVYPTTAMDLLVAAPGAEVDAPALEELGTREASGASYVHLSGQSLAAGSDIVIRFSGLGQPVQKQTAGVNAAQAPAGVAREPWWLTFVPLLALAALGPALLVHLRRSDRGDGPLSPREMSAAIDAEHDRLLTHMAELDESHEAGELKDASYRRQRRAAKRRLLGLTFDMQSEESDASGIRDAGRGRGSQGRATGKKVRSSGRSRRRRSGSV
jgi:hypothetical protein